MFIIRWASIGAWAALAFDPCGVAAAEGAETVPEIVAGAALAASNSVAPGRNKEQSSARTFLDALTKQSPLAFCWFEDLLPDRPEDKGKLPGLEDMLRQEAEKAIAEIARRGGDGAAVGNATAETGGR